MYLCKVCGNVKFFTEYNLIETELCFDETGKVAGSQDSFLECTEVVCRVCKATSKDGDILSKETGEKL